MRAVIVVRYTVPGSTGSSSGTATSVHRVEVPMHHDFKAAYFQALCDAAFFIMDAGDVERGKRIVEDSGRKWSNTMAFNFRYIAQLVRRKVPSPAVLHSRLEAVF